MKNIIIAILLIFAGVIMLVHVIKYPEKKEEDRYALNLRGWFGGTLILLFGLFLLYNEIF